MLSFHRLVGLGTGGTGRLPEWPKGADCKSVGLAYVGSNPTPATLLIVPVTCGNARSKSIMRRCGEWERLGEPLPTGPGDARTKALTCGNVE